MDKIILKILSYNKISNLKLNKNLLLQLNNNQYKIIKKNNKCFIKTNLKSPNSKSCITSTNNHCKLTNNTILKIDNIYYTIQKKNNKIVIKNYNTNKIINIPKNQLQNLYLKNINNKIIKIISPHNKHQLYYNDIIQLGGLKLQVSKFNYGIFHDIGKRYTFEDTYTIIQSLNLKKTIKTNISYFAVFDGHSGNETSEYAKLYLHKKLEKEINKNDNITENHIKNSIKNAILKIDKFIFNNKIPSGTTANLCLIIKNKIYSANVGDSRSVLCRNGIAIPLSYDHKPNNKNEYNRIISHNGYVKNGRVNGRLAVSRAIGDNDLKHFNSKLSPLTALPDILVTKLKYNDEFILIACDGLWDVINNQDACNFVKKRLKIKDIQLIAKELVYYAINKLHSSDNVTCLIVKL